MSSFRIRPATPEDAPAAARSMMALESCLYGTTTYTQADLEHEWSLASLERDVRVLLDGDAIAGFGALHDRGELWRLDGTVHPDAQGRGGGSALATALERDAAGRGARRVQSGVLEADAESDTGAFRVYERVGMRPFIGWVMFEKSLVGQESGQ